MVIVGTTSRRWEVVLTIVLLILQTKYVLSRSKGQREAFEEQHETTSSVEVNPQVAIALKKHLHSRRIDDNSNNAFTVQRNQISANIDPSCSAGSLCVGPGKEYSIGRQVGVVIEGQFVVPPLPTSFDKVETTYYDYLNIFWRNNPLPGYMNQFVPQLMLGNALANSSNYPDYDPKWIEMSSWHIGSQYFMALCRRTTRLDDTVNVKSQRRLSRPTFDIRTTTNDSLPFQEDYNCTDWIPKAVTGELIPVEPGEGIFTKFELVDSHREDQQQQQQQRIPSKNVEWHLSMGVIGDPSRVSTLIVPRPFMGLIDEYSNGTSSWLDPIYDQIYVGSCLENYGMKTRENYPSYWRINVNITVPPSSSSTDMHSQPVWHPWGMDHDKDCDWQPESAVNSNHGNGYQVASWEAWLDRNRKNVPTGRTRNPR